MYFNYFMKNENNEDCLVCSLLDRDLNQSWESLKLRGQISSYYRLDSIDSVSTVPTSPVKKAPVVQEIKKKQVFMLQGDPNRNF